MVFSRRHSFGRNVIVFRKRHVVNLKAEHFRASPARQQEGPDERIRERHGKIVPLRPVEAGGFEQQCALVHLEPSSLFAAHARLLEQCSDRVVARDYPSLALRPPIQVR